MIEIYVEVEEQPDGKTVTTIYAKRHGVATVKEELQVNAIVEVVAQYHAKVAKEGSTIVHRALPPAECCCGPDGRHLECPRHGERP